jgi:hypothetical protein
VDIIQYWMMTVFDACMLWWMDEMVDDEGRDASALGSFWIVMMDDSFIHSRSLPKNDGLRPDDHQMKGRRPDDGRTKAMPDLSTDEEGL